jgi:hypothetical protein
MQPIAVPQFIKQALKRTTGDQDASDFTPVQLNDALYELNNIINSWNADGDTIFTTQYYTFPLNAGQQVYTIGPSANADFNTGTQSRPAALLYAAFQVITSDPVIDVPLRILSPEEWASLRVKNLGVSIANYIYLEPQWPLGNIYLWGFPTVASNLVLTVWQKLNDALTLSSDAAIGINLPDAYTRTVGLELSIAMAPYYGKSGSADIALMAKQAAALKKKIAWLNLRGSQMVYSNEAQGTAPGAGGLYIIQTDSTA